MIRRANFTVARASSSLRSCNNNNSSGTITMSAAPATAMAQRNYVGPMDPWCSLFMCGLVTAAGASWGNNLFSLLKHGIWRHNMAIDSSFVVEGSRTWQYVGAFFGFLMYWNIVGQMKYIHAPDMNKWAKRFGNSPF